jgi:PAS domain S-box-containing protein
MVQEVSGREQQLRMLQDDLAQRERHYRALIENATDLVTILSPDGIIRYESPSVQRILGYTVDELIGRRAHEFTHPDDLASVGESMRRLADHPGDHGTFEFRFRHKDGTWRILEAQSSNLIGDPAVGGIVVNSRDITQRKRDEREILALNAVLEQRVRELRGAKEATDLAMKQQEIFLSNVSHDLRPPLTIVIGYSEDLLRRAKKLGHELLQAAEGLAGLALAQSERPDLILLDLDLGRFSIDGWEVNRPLVAEGRFRQASHSIQRGPSSRPVRVVRYPCGR